MKVEVADGLAVCSPSRHVSGIRSSRHCVGMRSTAMIGECSLNRLLKTHVLLADIVRRPLTGKLVVVQAPAAGAPAAPAGR